MNYRIRHAVFSDAPAIAEHNCSMAMETEGRKLPPETAHQGVIAVLSDPSKGFYVIAKSGGRIIGQCMITFEWSDWRCGTFWWIQSVYVRPECRRKGIFSHLFDFILEESRQYPDIAGIRLYVHRENRSAHEVYMSLGLEESTYIVFERDFSKNGG